MPLVKEVINTLSIFSLTVSLNRVYIPKFTKFSSNVLKTVIGTAAVFTIASVVAVSPLMEFIAKMVYNSGY